MTNDKKYANNYFDRGNAYFNKKNSTEQLRCIVNQ